ncbi:Glyoxylase, beta-lactamase superfamily II [Clostridium cavendishii DSM 21758]|uniref:Glyoxylase, beta-lactamase superfamily II n=1 Tax=Clostridium cavendishii DSM 21758 TaxID=1121302 RepID=A0A1M6AAB6_9CLOT|nr:MBL fold metallo-hydrolase [Clostridium cavendishii]SHI33399.1 Glyoxylase, beta-lactamase superfamily II [Clostridium cavendishii DSM 21758]
MIIKTIPAGIYGANCYVIYKEDNKQAIILDPGGDSDMLIANIEALEVTPKAILLTHGHIDHVGAVEALSNRYKIPFYINEEDEKFMMSGTDVYGHLNRKADGYIKDGDKLNIANLEIEVIHTPGHTPGGVCFLVNDKVFTGDTLFQGSIGRTDFEGGNYESIIESIVNKLLPLGDNVEVYPGHGPKSSILYEKRRNPFLN